MNPIRGFRLPFTPVLAAVALVAFSGAWAQDYFTLVAIPDTQKHVQVVTMDSEGPGDFGTQPFRATFGELTGWIVNHLQKEKIAFVTHVGDIVEHGGLSDPAVLGVGNVREWSVADAAMGKLDGVVPYGLSAGNHDFEIPNRGLEAFGADTRADRFLQYFGPQRFAGYPWYGGSSPASSVSVGVPPQLITHPAGLNKYQFFTAGGQRFLHFNLEWEIFDPAIA